MKIKYGTVYISHDMIINTIISMGSLGAAATTHDFVLGFANTGCYSYKIVTCMKNIHKTYSLWQIL